MKRDTTAYGAAQPKWDKNDCSVRALAVAVGCKYEVASALFSAFGRTLKKGTPVALSAQLHEEALHMTPVPDVVGWPLEAFIMAHPRGRFVVHKRGHAFAVVDGVLHDWERTTRETTRIERVMRVTPATLAKVAKIAALFD